MKRIAIIPLSICAIAIVVCGVFLCGCSNTASNPQSSGGSPLVQVTTTSPVSQIETIRVEESDPMIVYSPGWKNEQNNQASGGTWTLTGYGSYGYNNIKMTLTFNGTGIALVYLAAPFGGTAEVTLDGKTLPSIDMYSNNAAIKTVPIAAGLPDGVHTLVVSPAKNSNTAVVLPQSGAQMPLITIDAVEVARPK
ncbi:MAG: hypothetical protein OS112_10690 [Methanoregula sp.]|nr:MAG: hypothetical protein OS112_10690 [Methanoregula sp.]